jgi:membrane protease YdiL (CAAX protease family)
VAVASSSRTRLSLATGAGLVVALALPLLTLTGGRSVFGAEQSDARLVSGLVIHWVVFAAIVAVVVFWERQPLSSIGLRPLRWWTIPAGLVAGVVITTLSGTLVNVFKLSPDVEYAGYLQSLPFATRLLLVVTAGVWEEIAYRGYGIERLTMIWGSKWAAAVATVALFTLAHLPAVGAAHLMPVFIVSVFVTLLYLWRRDLVLNMVAHSTIDAVGLLLAPLMGQSIG